MPQKVHKDIVKVIHKNKAKKSKSSEKHDCFIWWAGLI